MVTLSASTRGNTDAKAAITAVLSNVSAVKVALSTPIIRSSEANDSVVW
jgi:hypothetical protein